MAEARDLRRECICGSQAPYHCRSCGSKYYCSRTCQRKDWPLHKQQCKNEDMITTALESRISHSEIDYVNVMGTPAWIKYLDILYDALRRKVGQFAEPHEFAVSWIAMINSEICTVNDETKTHVCDVDAITCPPQATAVAFVFIAQEPSRLYMFVDKPQKYRNEISLVCPEDSRNIKRLLDPKCVIYDLNAHQKFSNLAYPINLDRPLYIDTIVDWHLRTRY